MKTKTAFYTLIITIFLCLSSQVKANVLNVNNTLTSSESGSLNHALSLAVSGDTIHFDEALKTDTIELDSSIVIDKNITIEGNGITLSGNNATRIMMVNNGALLFIYDTKFILGKAVNGGAIYNNGILVVERCTFDKNLSDAPIGTVSCGGAVYNTNSFTAKASIFSNNKAQSHDEMAFGGAYGTTLDNTLTLLSEFAFCSFVNNTATAENISYSSYYYSAGGGLFLNNDNYNSNVKLISNIFQENISFYYYGSTGDFMLVAGGLELMAYNAFEGSSRWVYAISDLYPETVTYYGNYYSWSSTSNKYGSNMLVLDNNLYRIPQYSASGPIGIYTLKSSNYEIELPKEDILGDVVDYSQNLNAGACQSLSNLVKFNFGQSTGGTLSSDKVNGSYVNVGSEVTLTASPAVGYKLVGWNLNGTKDPVKATTIKVYPMGNYTVSAIFQNVDTLVMNASGGNTVGSLAYVISKCVGGETVIFADELANDTIVLVNTITIGRTITIQGNGVTLSGDNLLRILKTTQPIRISHVNFIRGAATYGGAIACDNGYNELYFTNCIFDSNKATDATLGGAAIKGGKPRLTACQFSNNVSAGKAGGVWGSYIISTACTYVNNSSTIGGGAIYEDAPNQNHTMQLTANVFQNNYNSSTMFTTDITMNARSFTSYGYNVHSGSHYAGTTYNPLAAEWESADKIITDPFLVEDNGVYKVWNTTSNTAMNLLPANLTITGATLPSKDILGDTIYYTRKTQAGACQSLITKPLLLVTITQANKGIIIASEFVGNKQLVSTNTEITFTATPSSEYKFYRWTVNGNDTTTTLPELKLTITQATTVSAKFQFTNPLVTSNSGANVAGSLVYIYNKCLGGETISFADELANDTIIFTSTLTITQNVNINGNGISFSGNGLVRTLFIYPNVTINISSIRFIDGHVANDGGAAIFNGGDLTLSSCEFRNNTAKSGGGYGGAAIRASCLGLNLINCSFVNNKLIPSGVLEEKKTGGAIHNLSDNTIMFGCVFQNNQAIDQPTTNDIDGKFTSLGYNVFTTTLSDQIATDKVSLIPSLIFEGGVYKVSNDSNCPAKGLIPANITISGINLPENDVLNAEIDRSTTTHAGSCQSTTENIQVFMNQTTGGTITCDAFTGTDAVFTPSQLAQITFTQQAAIGYQFEKWVINGKDSVNTDASISIPLKSVTISAVFRFIDTQVTTKVFNINTKGSLPYIIARCENNAIITFADALASETIVFGSTITVNDKSLTIVGNGITFSGSNARRILYVASGSRTLVLENLKFINGRTSGYDSDGAAIYSSSRLIVKRCLFKGNQNVQASCNNAFGGAIRLKNTGYFEACVFDSNLAQASGKGAGCGAGICANGDVSVVNCTFVNNFTTAASGVYNVSSGGAVFATGELYLAGNIFQDNDNTFAADSAKVVFGTPLVSEGYNILDNGFLASQWTSTDILTIDSIVSEVDYLPVQSSTNPIFGFIPANTQFSTIVMPTKDYIGNNIYYSKAFCSGACQSELMPVSVINTKDESSITVYPNPAKYFIIINLKEEGESDISVQLFSIDGKSVYKDIIKDKSFTINSSNFLTGSYILLVSTKNNIYRKKIIIKK